MVPSLMLLHEFFRTIYRPYHPQLSDGAAELYLMAIRSLSQYVGRPATIDDLSEEVLIAWINWRLSHAAPKTVRRQRGELLALWRFAYRRRVCSCPCGDIPVVVVRRPVPVAWSPEEVRALVAAAATLPGHIRGTQIAQGDWWVSLLLFLYATGARISAALAVAPSHLDTARGFVQLRPETAKTGMGQVLRLPQYVVDAVSRIYDPRASRVWVCPYHRHWLFGTLGRICRLAGLPADRGHKFHCLRRTHATMVAAFGSLDLAQRDLGHTSPAMTWRYIDPRFLGGPTAADVLPPVTVTF